MSWEISGRARSIIVFSKYVLWFVSLFSLAIGPLFLIANYSYYGYVLENTAFVFLCSFMTFIIFAGQAMFYQWSPKVSGNEVRFADSILRIFPRKKILRKDQIAKVIVEKKGYVEVLKQISPTYFVKIMFIDKNGNTHIIRRPFFRGGWKWTYYTSGYFNDEADLERFVKEFSDYGIEIERRKKLI